jgi:hypothetical protein
MIWSPATRSAILGSPHRRSVKSAGSRARLQPSIATAGPLFVLEGGYDPATLATCVIETILDFEEGEDVDRADEAAIPARQRAILGELEGAAACTVV